MKYITGTPALNLVCELDTSGDWHHSSVDWQHVYFAESDSSIYADWGIASIAVPYQGVVPVANHLRALLDLIDAGYFSSAQGMKDDFLDRDDLTPIVFDQVWRLRKNDNWPDIDAFMGKEYACQWLDYRSSKEG
jgi:hypothetical protein